MSVQEETSLRDPLDEVAESFVVRFRRGERPSVAEYMARHPELADAIQTLFPALIAIEEVSQAQEPAPGSVEERLFGCRPERLGDFRILREIGRGGMGVVYEAEQESLGRRVALKVLLRDTSLRTDRAERFLREARAAAQLHHTNIVPVHGVGRDDECYYYVMQLIDGRPLDEVQRELREWQDQNPGSTSTGSVLEGASESAEPKPERHYWNSIATLAAQAADALAYAHQQGILHRDVKPSNLLLDRDGVLWVADFGLAKFVKDADLTFTGDVVGTLRYMAPERFEGRSEARSDIYGLGATLYEMATLQPAFAQRDPHRLVRQVMHEEPPRPRKRRADVPHDLETIILKAMEKDPAQRYATATELADELRRFIADRPIHARRVTSPERLWRWVRRNRMIASLVVTVALLLATVSGTTAASHVRLRAKHVEALAHMERAMAAEQEAWQAEANEQAARQLATYHWYEALVERARAGRSSRRAGQRFESLEAIADAVRLADEMQLDDAARGQLRSEAAACLQLDDLRPLHEWPYATGKYSHLRVAFDRELTRYATFDDGELAIRRMADNRLLGRISDLGLARERPYLRFSPDGRALAAKAEMEGGGLQLFVWDLAYDPECPPLVFQATAGGRWEDEALDFSPDGRRLAVADGTGIAIYRCDDGASPARWHGPQRAELDVAPYVIRWSPDGRQLAVAQDDRLELLTGDGRRSGRWLLHPDSIATLAWSSDGRRLVTGCDDRRVRLWDAVTRQVVATCEGHRASVRHVIINHRGDLLASWGWDGTMRLWDSGSGQELLSGLGIPAAFGPDDRALAWVDPGTAIGCWEVSPRRYVHTLSPSHGMPIQRVQVALGARILAATGPDGVDLWDLYSGHQLGQLPGAACVIPVPQQQALITVGPAGAFEWPVGWEGDQLLLGPPQAISTAALNFGFADADAHWIGAGVHQQFVTLAVRETPASPQAVIVEPNLHAATLAPDGRWLAVAPRTADDIRIWETASGQQVATLPMARGGNVVFSPDSRRLVVSSLDTVAFWNVDPWRLEATVPSRTATFGPAAFSPDGKLLALATETSRVQLLEMPTRRLLFELHSPTQEQVWSLCFSPDERWLIAGTTSGPIHVWDLAALESGLAALGLAWRDDARTAGMARIEQSGVRPVTLRLSVGLPPAGSTVPLALTADKLLGCEDVARLTADLLRQPDNPVLFRRRGRAHERSGRPAEARLDYQHAIKLYTRRIEAASGADAHAYGGRGASRASLGHYRAAIADFEEALALQPDAAGWHAQRADALRSLGRLEDAVAGYSRAIEIRPDFQHALYWRGRCYFLLERDVPAAADFHRSLELRPVDAWPCAWLAWIQVMGDAELRDPAGALALAKEAVSLQPELWRPRFVLAVVYFRLRQWENMLAQLDAHPEDSSGPAAAADLLLRALAHWQRGDRAAALADYRRLTDGGHLSTRLSGFERRAVADLLREAAPFFSQAVVGPAHHHHHPAVSELLSIGEADFQ